MDHHIESYSARVLLIVSAIKWGYGMVICIYLYGRKVPPEGEVDDDDDEDD